MKPTHLLLWFALSTPALLAPGLARADDAGEAFLAKHDAVLALVEQGAGDRKLGQVIDDMLDYEWLAQASLGGPENYGKVCGQRCDEFQALLSELIRANYIRLARQAKDHPIEYVGEVEGRGGIFKVTTKLEVEKNGRKRNMTVAYVMHKNGERWQVRDIITDDVSLVRTYRHEFNKIARGGGIDALITKLEEKLAAQQQR